MRKNSLIKKIKDYLRNEANFIELLSEHDDPILEGRKELADNLLEQIIKWEHTNEK